MNSLTRYYNAIISKYRLYRDTAFLNSVVANMQWMRLKDGSIYTSGSVYLAGDSKAHRLIGKTIFFKEVGGNFSISYNAKITSLKGCPEIVRGSFDCSWTNIDSLQGAPKEVGGSFYCTGTKITSLEGAPEKVGRAFECWDTKTLTSLKGSPKEVGGYFDCSDTKITSLDGIGEVKGTIYSDLEI